MRFILPVLILLMSSSAGAQSLELTVMTYNTKHAGRAPYSADGQMDVVARQQPRPDVVLLQEVPQREVARYVAGLNARYGFSGRGADSFQQAYWPGCAEESDGECSRTRGEGNATLVVPRFPITGREGRFFFEADHWNAGREALRVAVRVGSETVQVFNIHLQPNHEGTSAEPQRVKSVETLRAWAEGYRGARVIGGDFNARPGSPEISDRSRGMAADYLDAWSAVGRGEGLTGGNPQPRSRIDYLFSDAEGRAMPIAVRVPDASTQSDHRPVVATYRLSSTATPTTEDEEAEAVATAAEAPTSRWTRTVFSGTQDMRVASVEADDRITIGPLIENASGPHYNGMTLANTADMTKRSVTARLVHAPAAATTAYAMFTVGGAGNHYRFYVSNGRLVVQRKLNGVKRDAEPIPYDPIAHQFLRIRHDGTNVVFETAPEQRGAPGKWSAPLLTEPWDPTIPLADASIEVKAGTSRPEIAPGSVIWSDVAVSAISTISER